MTTTYLSFSTEPPIVIREVWAHNLDSEFALIGALISRYPYIAIDTEFPGFIFQLPLQPWKKPSTPYPVLKANVDALNLIQVGLTLADSNGNLPDLGGDNRFIWQFNFRDFDVTHDLCNKDSIEMLQKQGINFFRNWFQGIDSFRFAELMISYRLVCNNAIHWVTFQGAYDFAYLIKILTRRPLPGSLGEFLWILKMTFGDKVYDIKHIMQFCHGLHGGLNQVAKTLQVERQVGNFHQAGSDSLLTSQVFQKMRYLYAVDEWVKHAGVLYGLE